MHISDFVRCWSASQEAIAAHSLHLPYSHTAAAPSPGEFRSANEPPNSSHRKCRIDPRLFDVVRQQLDGIFRTPSMFYTSADRRCLPVQHEPAQLPNLPIGSKMMTRRQADQASSAGSTRSGTEIPRGCQAFPDDQAVDFPCFASLSACILRPCFQKFRV